MRIKRSILKNTAWTNREAAKDIAFAIYVRQRTGNTEFHNFSYRRFSEVTGISYRIAKKRIGNLASMGLAEWRTEYHRRGGTSLTLVFDKLRSSHDEHNVMIAINKDDTIKTITDKISAYVIAYVNQERHWMGSLVYRLAHNRVPLDEVKKLGKKYRLSSLESKTIADNGISYNQIAGYLGVGIQTAVRIVRKAARLGWIKVIHRKAVAAIGNLAELLKYGIDINAHYHYTKGNMACVVLPNKYLVSRQYSNDACSSSRVDVENGMSWIRKDHVVLDARMLGWYEI